MQLIEDIQRVIEKLPEDRLREILDFARFIAQARENEEWRAAAKQQFARAYGPNEPEYSATDIKTRIIP